MLTSSSRHSGENRNPEIILRRKETWIPVFTGMTEGLSTLFQKAKLIQFNKPAIAFILFP